MDINVILFYTILVTGILIFILSVALLFTGKNAPKALNIEDVKKAAKGMSGVGYGIMVFTLVNVIASGILIVKRTQFFKNRV